LLLLRLLLPALLVHALESDNARLVVFFGWACKETVPLAALLQSMLPVPGIRRSG
jgi:hypothetical protein